MGVPKIVSFMPFPVEAQRSWCLKYVDPSEVEFSVESIDLSEDEMCEAVSDADMILAVPMTPFMSRRVLEAAKKLKLVKFGSVGYDRIDLEAAVELGIPVTNNDGINAITVAEQALMMILVLQKKAFLFHEEVMEGSWPSYTPGDMWELRGRNLGILGLGSIGTELAKIARGFGAKILYNKRNRLSGEAEAELGVEYRSLEDLLKESDVLSVHVPLTDETRHIIGKDQVAMMKDGAIVVNTSRRDVVLSNPPSPRRSGTGSSMVWGSTFLRPARSRPRSSARCSRAATPSRRAMWPAARGSSWGGSSRGSARASGGMWRGRPQGSSLAPEQRCRLRDA